MAGTGTAGNNGNLGPAVDAQLNAPTYLSRYGGSHLLIGDSNNEAIRVLW